MRGKGIDSPASGRMKSRRADTILDKKKIEQFGDALYDAMITRETIDPLTEQAPGIQVEDAYQISLRMLERRTAAGEHVIGKKIGVTSKAVMDMLEVYQPDFGFLTDRMMFSTGAEVPGPGVTNADVLAATDFVMPCFEIVDSRIRDWKIKIQDTISDNASCGVVVMGDRVVKPTDVDLSTCGMVVELNGEIISTGAGAAALGSPVNSVTWLANTLGSFGIELEAGEVILSGSLVPLQPVKAGDNMHLAIGGIGQCSVRFN